MFLLFGCSSYNDCYHTCLDINEGYIRDCALMLCMKGEPKIEESFKCHYECSSNDLIIEEDLIIMNPNSSNS